MILVGNRLTRTHDHGDDDDMTDALDTLVEYVYDLSDRLLIETRDVGPEAGGRAHA